MLTLLKCAIISNLAHGWLVNPYSRDDAHSFRDHGSHNHYPESSREILYRMLRANNPNIPSHVLHRPPVIPHPASHAVHHPHMRRVDVHFPHPHLDPGARVYRGGEMIQLIFLILLFMVRFINFISFSSASYLGIRVVPVHPPAPVRPSDR
jgi:hypothetical protein